MLEKLFNAIEFSLWQSRVRWIKTLYFNLRSFPIKVAIKLPVYIYSNVEFVTLSGNIELLNPVKRGSIRIGMKCDRGQGVTIIRNMGTMKLGENVKIFQGCDILVGKKAILEVKKNARIRENCLVYVSNYVSIGERTGIAYQSSISEDDYHYIINSETGEAKNCKEPIIIGDNNWIGSRTVIKKGTKTPSNIIVASSYSLLGKDYTKSIPEYSIIGVFLQNF